ncbi:putative ABC transport system ATP-binding protein [Lachnotalea glycerini]|uniref:ABC transporter ATP-binding protein n=1 Tax=Lachnotalea glycerini TaxID=1763509 RepID=A0A255IPN9_9FIRM|nr:ABC transporter ATP-binding protein [Lachnotalea glycerini]PXV87743.1 putative ABC transport system ATP-binding protein [Lachnotalea glycerini]RDY32089.1 ABC transporter ATP-binding protein [Lachnotalea glycerini]
MKKIIVAQNVIKTFEEEQEKNRVLNDVSLFIEEGEFVSVMGPSGSGKSTLLYALSGMDRVDEGQIYFGDMELSKMTEKELSRLRLTKMGFVFQQAAMLKNLNLLDNIILPSIHENKKNAKHILEKARSLMEQLGIGELINRDITKVSGGQLQRAGICRALLNHPQIIFGDEPTGALNSQSAEEIMNIFKIINEDGTTIMLVTHDAKVAARTKRVLYMQDGMIVAEQKLSKYNGKNLKERVSAVTNKLREIGI